MAEFNIEELIKDLSPEMQEKARAFTTPQQLIELADENDIEITSNALEQVSGGCEGDCDHNWVYIGDGVPLISGQKTNKYRCSKCGKEKQMPA